MTKTSAKCKFANETQQARDGCPRNFANHSREVHILCDWVEDNYPIGRILVTPYGIRIEISADKNEVPITIVRTTSISG